MQVTNTTICGTDVGDAVYTNFRMPLLPANLLLLTRTLPKLGDGADVTVQTKLAADGSVALTMTPIDPATGLPRPYGINPLTGTVVAGERINCVEFDVVVTNPLRRLHGFDRAFGPATRVGNGGGAAFNWDFLFDATRGNQFTSVANDESVAGIEIDNAGAVTARWRPRRCAQVLSASGSTQPRADVPSSQTPPMHRVAASAG